MQERVKISIITVSYNCAATIERTIQSVIEQDYPYVEYIVIDGGSTDGTKEIIEKYADKLSYWVSEPDEGIYNAMNKALMHVTGDYVNFQGGDDYLYDKDVLKNVGTFVEENGADIVVGISNYGGTLVSTCPKDLDGLLNGSVNHQAVFAKNDIFKKIGLFNENLKYVADYDWLIRAYIEGFSFAHLEKIVCYYELGGFSGSVKACKELIDTEIMYACSLKKFYLVDKLIKHRQGAVKARIIDTYTRETRDSVGEFLKKCISNNRICIWGTGKAGGEFAKLLGLYGIEISGFIDKEYSKYPDGFYGKPVEPFDVEKEYDLVVIAAYGREKDIESELLVAKREYMIGKDYLLGSNLMRVLLNMGLNEYDLNNYYCF